MVFVRSLSTLLGIIDEDENDCTRPHLKLYLILRIKKSDNSKSRATHR